MSAENLARRARLEMTFDGVSIPETLMRNVESLTYTDNEEYSCDDLSVVFADRDGNWIGSWASEAILATAAERKITAKILFDTGEQVRELDCGEFELDDVTISAPPMTANLKATSLPYASAIRKTVKSKVWKSTSLQKIAESIAKKGGLSLVWECSGEMAIEREEQYKQSDIAFLSHLCHERGVALKVTDGQLVLFDQSEFERRPTDGVIRMRDKGWLKFSLTTGEAGTKYGSCVVTCFNEETGVTIKGKAKDDDGDSSHVLNLNLAAKTQEYAERLAKAYLRLYNKSEVKASFTFPGNTSLAAGLKTTLEGFGKFDGEYIISRAAHSVSSGGYTTTIQLRKVLRLI